MGGRSSTFIFSVLAAGAVSRRLLTMSTRWRI
jgi:hypothetical protein